MFERSVGKKPVPYIASSRTSTGGSIGTWPCAAVRSTAKRYKARASRAVSPTRYPKREPESRAARSISKRPTSVCSGPPGAGSPTRRSSSASSSESPSGADGSGGFGTCSSSRSRSASAAASSSSAAFSSSFTRFSSSSSAGVGLPFSFSWPRSSSVRGTSARQRSSASISASNASAAPFRASAARKPSGSLRAALRSITRLSLESGLYRPSSAEGHAVEAAPPPLLALTVLLLLRLDLVEPGDGLALQLIGIDVPSQSPSSSLNRSMISSSLASSCMIQRISAVVVLLAQLLVVAPPHHAIMRAAYRRRKMAYRARYASITCATPSSVTGGQTKSATASTRSGRSRPRRVAGPLEQLDVVLAVAERDRPRRDEAEPLREERPAPSPSSLSGPRTRGSTGATWRCRAAAEVRLHAPSRPSSSTGSPTATSFVGGSSSQASRSPTACTSRCWNDAYASRRRGMLGHVQLVVDVAVQRVALGLDCLDRLARELERDRLVAQQLAADRVGDDRALVADDGVVDPGRLRVRPHRPEHPPGDEDHVDAGRARRADRRARPWPELGVLPISVRSRSQANARDLRGEVGGRISPSSPTRRTPRRRRSASA